MVHYDYDVIVVGGGPAGVIAAITIAKAGYQCVILDKKSRDQIGNKNCGDALDKDYTDILKKELNIDPPSLERKEARDNIKRVRIAAGDINTKIIANVPGYQVDRLAYGQRLLSHAEDLGVIILPHCPVRGIIIENDHVTGIKYAEWDKSNSGAELKELRSKIVIDASGYIGAVRKHISKQMARGIDLSATKRWTIATYREIIELKHEHPYREEIVLLYHEKIPPPGYAWVFTEGERKLNIGITWIKSDDYPTGKSIKKLYHELLDPYFDPKEYSVLYSGGGNIPARVNYDTMVVNGAIITGDAAALADPTTFEGHGPALESGRIAGKTSIECLKKGSYTYRDLWSYNKIISSYPGSLHAQSFIAANSIRELGVDSLEYLLSKELIKHEDLQEIFVHGGQLSFKQILRIIAKSFPRWDLLIKLRKILRKIEKIAEHYRLYPDDPDGITDWIQTRDEILGFSF